MTTDTLETHLSTGQRRSLLERTLSVSTTHLEIAIYVAIVVLSIVAHLWNLDVMAMHHDESIHAWSSWRYYSGSGGFNCYGEQTSASYCYDPVYHGPSLYMLTLVSYFLFGDGDAQARLPMAAAGIVMVASCWMLRPLIGRKGALIAAILLGFSPSLLYYTRFARHDGLMVLWEIWMVVSVFRYLDTGKSRFLYLLAASLALAIGTHELYYILFFIFGIFVIVRVLSEIPATDRYLSLGLLILLGLCVVLIVINPPLPIGKGLYLGEKAFLAATTLVLAWFSQRVWTRQPVLLTRMKDLWINQRTTLWIALGILGTLYTVMYTNFFSYPRGAIDGLYAGLAYWLGSQQEYARGDQPWYYYLIQLPLYEPLGIITGIGAAFYLFTRKGTRIQLQKDDSDAGMEHAGSSSAVQETDGQPQPDAELADEEPNGTIPLDETALSHTDSSSTPATATMKVLGLTDTDGRAARLKGETGPMSASSFFPLLLLFWYVSSIVIFSWAGEKMPWLVVHMALPGHLVAAWALGKLFSNTTPQSDDAALQPHPPRWLFQLTPVLVFLLVIALSVAVWRLQTPGEGQEAQRNLLQGVIPLMIGGGLIYSLLTIAQHIGARAVLSLAGLTVATVLGAYMIHASWMVVYDHPDTPVEPLIYTQTSPDVTRYVKDIYELSITMSRNHRTDKDPTGSFSLPVIVDNGDESGGGSLAWPLQWYFRHLTKLTWKSANEFKDPTAKTFEVTMPDGSTGLAPVVMIYKHHITDNTRTFLRQHYVQPYGDGGALNWWFPEGDKCSPNNPGYKKFYFHNWMATSKLVERVEKDCGRDISAEVKPPWAPLLWPFQAENWDTLKNYVLYRKIPSSLQLGAREMEVWIRQDIVNGVQGVSPVMGGDMSLIHILADETYGSPAELNGPTGLTVDSKGTVYVADTLNHRIQVFDNDGTLKRTIGSYGKGTNQFDEPRGIAVDKQGTIYVADTWNARIVKLDADGTWIKTWGTGTDDVGNGHLATITGGTQEGNQANPLGFFGPRGITLDDNGNVYIADTGNKRIVVTDNDGNYLYQWGYAGSGDGQFNEPTSVGRDAGGNIYVADTWNSRVQVFPADQNGQVSPTPIVTWGVADWLPDTYFDPSLGVTPDGTVYVSVPSDHYVQASNIRGNTMLRWGGVGSDTASLNAPGGIAVGPDGTVYVADREANRILRFTLPRVRPNMTTVEMP